MYEAALQADPGHVASKVNYGQLLVDGDTEAEVTLQTSMNQLLGVN